MDSSLDILSAKNFVKIANLILRRDQSGILHVPQIIAKNMEYGHLILEDFGNISINSFLNQNPDQAETIYKHAIDILISLHKINVDSSDGLDCYDKDRLNSELSVFIDYYLKHIIRGDDFATAESSLYKIFTDLHNSLSLKNILVLRVLRDYHADNLMYIDNKIGLLDFQDAVIGSPMYDIASLLKDTRRVVDQNFANDMLQYYIDLIAGSPAYSENVENYRKLMHNEYMILSLQRNIRIVGAFHRLNRKYNKPQYLKLLSHVWIYIYEDLKYDLLSPLRDWFYKYDAFDQE